MYVNAEVFFQCFICLVFACWQSFDHQALGKLGGFLFAALDSRMAGFTAFTIPILALRLLNQVSYSSGKVRGFRQKNHTWKLTCLS